MLHRGGETGSQDQHDARDLERQDRIGTGDQHHHHYQDHDRDLDRECDDERDAVG